ncbi:MAG: manganese-dependent ADP-ribose/CDP-alcohol diphosphatase, partial [Planctomycetota bacterium]
RLTSCVKGLNQRDLAFVMQLGDFIDDGKDSFDDVLPIWKKLNATRRSVIGNHDLPFLRERVLRKLELESPYYDFAVGDTWRFVVLDGMDVSLYGYPKNHPKRREATRMLASLKERKLKNAQRWNGGIGKSQLTWLEGVLIDAAKQQQRVVLCCHFPILEKASSAFHLLWNHVAVRKLLAKHECVFAWCNGHDHKGGYAQDAGIHHLTFAGMVEAPKKNAFAVVHAFHDRLVIEGIGKQSSLTLQVPVRKPARKL